MWLDCKAIGETYPFKKCSIYLYKEFRLRNSRAAFVSQLCDIFRCKSMRMIAAIPLRTLPLRYKLHGADQILLSYVLLNDNPRNSLPSRDEKQLHLALS